ncbi:hypothetical protein N836_10535 [Leptolyngbya sp. Heron Island J]|uniref:hypothetical protein n=1 Tax=Leptolyngbya sp. Heron Island J TaxID=1385935 RepID=UPI0003B99CC6|nr:hypothetical protein [Leptolyngbya sp. Heron Island J]ESA35767.1 hypothetical protein N836_10535 [Leptolyngbya sp. Heron Island J]
MNLFSQSRPKPNLAALQQIKTWVYDLLKLDPDIGISVSQLQCKEPDCPPIETVITILSQPAQQYKIHKALDDVEQVDLIRLFQTE